MCQQGVCLIKVGNYNVYGKISHRPRGILEDRQIQVRRENKVYKDSVEIAKIYHRHVLALGENLAGQDKRVANVAGLI